MSSQDDGGVSFYPPPEVDDWLAEEATRRGESRGAVCRRLVSAAHAVTTDDHEPAARDDLAELRGQLEAQREEFSDHLEDVRDRVVQVKRETDGKASADHDHPDLATAADCETLEEDLATLADRVDSGFDNFETVLEELLAETDALADRSTALARAVVDLREQRQALAERRQRREAADRLRLAANRVGIRTAACEDCDSSVDIALLTAPECPRCASQFSDVAERSSIFGSHRLLTGDPPALEGRADGAGESLTDEVFDAVEAAADGEESTAADPSTRADGEER
ncbi:hypothetical protein [Natrinema marinum]|uniref:hypothetical protein n=1 Tax=Natrinema marinum TaxID=2961598 RepID=UPI0020C91100|nr:hypothetical protein [Natrinema marinum]